MSLPNVDLTELKQAFDLFFQTSQNKIQLNLLENLCDTISGI